MFRNHERVHNKLWDNSTTFGKDGSADEFLKVYGSAVNNAFAAADAVFAGFVKAHSLLGEIGKGLAVSAANHGRADEASTPAAPSSPDPVPEPIPTKPLPSPDPLPPQTPQPGVLQPELDINKLDVPQISGDTRPWLKSLEPLWPLCNDQKAGAINDAYHEASIALGSLFNDRYSDIRGMIRTNDSEDLRALDDFLGRVAGGGNTFFTDFPQLVEKWAQRKTTTPKRSRIPVVVSMTP